MTRTITNPWSAAEGEVCRAEEGIYLDNNATTPIDPRVIEAMLPWLGRHHGNPSSSHAFGRMARAAVDRAREQIAELLRVGGACGSPEDIVFVASGTEANNMVIRSIGLDCDHAGHVVAGSMEHPSIRAACARLAVAGMETTSVPPSADGRIDPAGLAEALRPETRLVSVMLANNEIGTIQPITELASVCRERGVPLLCDAVQAVGKIEVDVGRLGADFVVLAGHKFHGPPGVAAFWCRPGHQLRPLLVGGGQESGLRSSTENVPAIVGLGTAAELAHTELAERSAHLSKLRDALEAALRDLGGRIRCAASPRLPNTVNVGFAGQSGQDLATRLDQRGIAVSTGAACHDGLPTPSHTLVAIGLEAEDALSSLRISLGLQNDRSDIETLASTLSELLS